MKTKILIASDALAMGTRIHEALAAVTCASIAPVNYELKCPPEWDATGLLDCVSFNRGKRKCRTRGAFGGKKK